MLRGKRHFLSTPLILAGIVVASSIPARADIVLHEYIEGEATEDLRLGATTSDGAMAAAIHTESGAVAAPNMKQRPPEVRNVYGGAEVAGGAGATYRIDRDTSQPPVVSYDDPFTPEVTPFKRQFAYDGVNDRLELVVNDATLSPIEIGGRPNADDDQFYADMQVDLLKGDAVRIPSVGPGARVLGIRTEPPTPIELLRDGADNWFVRAEQGGRIRLAMQIAIDRAVFGSEFADVEWSSLALRVPPLAAGIRQAGRNIASRIGVTDALAPAAAVRTLVEYFRGFAPSADRPESSGLTLYEELSLSRKGVCRHRAFAFVVTALSIGLPARMVRNEAHAWVEVFDGSLWHRTDLGGAAGRVELSAEDRPAHIAPRDPYAWPPGSDSGLAAAERARSGGGGRSGASGTGQSARQGTDRAAEPEPEPEAAPDASAATVTIGLDAKEARRGGRVRVRGSVQFEGEPCKVVRVDLHLRQKDPVHGRERIHLGTLVTDQEGRYDGQVHVSRDISIGDYEVIASTPGNLECGAGQTR